MSGSVHVCTSLCVCETEGEGDVACVLRCKAKYVFFSVGLNQPRLRATDLEHANGAKQRVIASGIPKTERFNPCVAAGMAPQRVFGSGD